MAWGFVYVLGNDCMPGIYKIGMTEKAPQERLEQLSSATAVPEPFWMAFYAQVEDARRVERSMHEYFDDCRVNRSREFFRVDLRELRDVLERYTEPPLIHEIHFEPHMWIQDQQDFERGRLAHFLNQCHDPIHWKVRRGFEGFCD